MKYFIYFFFIVFFLNGLENIDTPPFDGHEWRQTLTIVISKELNSFYNFFHPYTIIGGHTNVIGSEFPFYNLIVSLLNKLFGYQIWYGRLVNWLVSVIGLWYFNKIILLYWSKKIAWSTMIFIGSSIVYQYARKTMPDTFALSLGWIGCYWAIIYLKEGNRKAFWFGGLLMILCGLCKIPFVIAWAWVLLHWCNNRKIGPREINLSIFLAIGAIVIFAWYYLWVPHLLEQGGSQLFFSFSLSDGAAHLYNLRWTALDNIFRHTFHNIPLTFIGFIGLGLLFKKENNFGLWALGYIMFFVLIIVKSGTVFPVHDYYLIPLVPIISLGAALLLDQLSVKPIITLLIAFIISVPGYVYNKRTSFNSTESKYYQNLHSLVDKSIPKDAKVLVNGGEFNPVMMFWSGRKGWTFKNEDFIKINWLQDIANTDGLQYIIQDKNKLADTVLNLPIIVEDNDFLIYKIGAAPLQR